tara:strand:- start:72 stop:569 length:498 start_codon:yes stop_codon:yes gene_type:complete
MNNSLLDTAVVPIQKLENAKPSNAMINTGQSKPLSFNLGGSVAPPEVQLAEPPPINLASGGMPNAPMVPVAKTIEATTYSGDTVGEGIANLIDPNVKFPFYRQFEGQPEEFTKENPVLKYMEENKPMTIEPPRPKMDPQLQMILQAQTDTTGLIGLMNRNYKETI